MRERFVRARRSPRWTPSPNARVPNRRATTSGFAPTCSDRLFFEYVPRGRDPVLGARDVLDSVALIGERLDLLSDHDLSCLRLGCGSGSPSMTDERGWYARSGVRRVPKACKARVAAQSPSDTATNPEGATMFEYFADAEQGAFGINQWSLIEALANLLAALRPAAVEPGETRVLAEHEGGDLVIPHRDFPGFALAVRYGSAHAEVFYAHYHDFTWADEFDMSFEQTGQGRLPLIEPDGASTVAVATHVRRHLHVTLDVVWRVSRWPARRGVTEIVLPAEADSAGQRRRVWASRGRPLASRAPENPSRESSSTPGMATTTSFVESSPRAPATRS